MEIFGDLNFKNVGSLMQVSLASESSLGFPSANQTIAGRLAFFNKRVWIAADLGGNVVAWVPLTNEVDSFVHTQASGSDTWTIAHNLNTGTPVVQVYDANGESVIPNTVTPTTNNQVVITFGSSTIGRAIVLSGNFEGNSKVTNVMSYTHEQSIPAIQWVVQHALGHYPVVRVYTSSGQEIQPADITHNNFMQTTITFSTNTAGSARFV